MQMLHVTGLTVAMFHDEASGQQVPCPDDKAGLYVRTHSGQEVKVVAEADHLMFQAGETLQVVSNGLFRATEHCVVPPECADSPTLSRSVFVVFCQPKYVTAVQDVLVSCCMHWNLHRLKQRLARMSPSHL
jgi:isopenicillin N synthase-like dioxygenase